MEPANYRSGAYRMPMHIIGRRDQAGMDAVDSGRQRRSAGKPKQTFTKE
jgi:hypothetical protein